MDENNIIEYYFHSRMTGFGKEGSGFPARIVSEVCKG